MMTARGLDACRAGFSRPRHDLRTTHERHTLALRFRPETRSRVGLGACPETAVHGSGGTVSASIRRRWTRVRERPTRAVPHRRSDGAPAPVLRRAGPRAPPPAGELTPPRGPTPAAGAGSRRRHRRRPIRRALRHAAEHEATKAHRLLALGVPATDVRHAREAE